MFSYNTTIHSTTNFSPYELVFGHKPNLPRSIVKEAEFKYTYDDYLDDLQLKFRRSCEIARNNILNSKQENTEYYDKRSRTVEFKVEDQV